MVSPIGLPVFADSTATNSSARASNASAILSRAFCRSEGVVRLQSPNAFAAAPNAASTSAAPDTGAVAIASPVDGSTMSASGPSETSTNAPSMKLRSRRTAPAISVAISAPFPSMIPTRAGRDVAGPD